MIVEGIAKPGYPDPPFFVPSDDLLVRLIAAYRFSHHNFGMTDGHMWRTIFAKQADLHETLMNGRISTLRDLLSNPGRTYLYYGVDNLFPDNIALLAGSKTIRDDLDRMTLQSVASLLQMIGGATPDGIERQLDVLDSVAGHRFTFPHPFRDEFGVPTSRGLVTYRSVHAIYQALRLRSLVEGNTDRRIVEIGGGMGRTCYFVNQLGMTSYTIVDLPMTLIGQALMLAATIREDAFRLPGETAHEGADINLALPGQIKDMGRFDVAINVDSLTEMSHAQAKDYFRLMRKQCGILLSINHEDNCFFVRDFERPISRKAISLRDGYFEEVYTLSQQAASLPGSSAAKYFYRRMRRRISRTVFGFVR